MREAKWGMRSLNRSKRRKRRGDGCDVLGWLDMCSRGSGVSLCDPGSVGPGCERSDRQELVGGQRLDL